MESQFASLRSHRNHPAIVINNLDTATGLITLVKKLFAKLITLIKGVITMLSLTGGDYSAGVAGDYS